MANAAPKPELTMPISKAMAFDFSFPIFKDEALRYPNNRPRPLNKKIAIKTMVATESSLLELAATTIPITRVTAKIEITGTIPSHCEIK